MTPGDAEGLLRELVEIPSVSGDESRVAAFLAAAAGKLGFDSGIDAAGNMIASRGPAAAPVVMLIGHMDTVPGEARARQEGSLLYGRGTVDAKGPLAAMICAAADADIGAARVVVAGTVQEETTGQGAEYLGSTHSPACAIVGEPNGWAGVGIGYKGRVTLRYGARRPACHTASPGEKATEAVIAFWNRVTGYLDGHGPADRVFDRPIATAYEFSGTIEHAMIDIWCRVPPGFDLAAFESRARQWAEGDELTVGDRTPGIRVSPATAAVRALCAAIRGQGGQPRLKLKSGTADLNVVGKYWDIPMAVYGPGDSSLDHTDGEHIDLHEYGKSVAVLTSAVQTMTAAVTQGSQP
jgi:[amino group carrier protein]-lysine/ornithine hydrolase